MQSILSIFLVTLISWSAFAQCPDLSGTYQVGSFQKNCYVDGYMGPDDEFYFIIREREKRMYRLLQTNTLHLKQNSCDSITITIDEYDPINLILDPKKPVSKEIKNLTTIDWTADGFKFYYKTSQRRFGFMGTWKEIREHHISMKLDSHGDLLWDWTKDQEEIFYGKSYYSHSGGGCRIPRISTP